MLISDGAMWVIEESMTSHQLQGLLVLLSSAGLLAHSSATDIGKILRGEAFLGGGTRYYIFQSCKFTEDISITCNDLVTYLEEKIKQNANSHSV